MRKNLGLIIGKVIEKRDATEGTIYYTENFDYLVLEEEGKYVVEGRLPDKDDKERLKILDFILEDDDSFLLGYFESEKEIFEAIADFERSFINKKIK